ncbi:hypothetical protein G7046_g6141 [Stylonectria norvegica]|nr:hypothetical protein G7046_g6141 [Stylonectria norvegica]
MGRNRALVGASAHIRKSTQDPAQTDRPWLFHGLAGSIRSWAAAAAGHQPKVAWAVGLPSSSSGGPEAEARPEALGGKRPAGGWMDSCTSPRPLKRSRREELRAPGDWAVLSFMSQFSAGAKTPPQPSSPTTDSAQSHRKAQSVSEPFPDHHFDSYRPVTPPSRTPSRPEYGTSPVNESPVNSPQRQRSNSRPLSMVLPHQPPLMEINEDTIPELQPIFSFLNSHSNKLYQEGYFLKLDDQNTQGKPNPDRTWTECFAQLVGTVLSLWDAAELDAAGEDGEVLPKFINLTDASIKMIESLPTRSSDEQPLQNILSISTAGRNRYLLHFNSHHSLIQWTAGIRLSMFEHSTLQEAYTGALIAGKGKTLNNINVVMERSRFKTEEWVRVRFGAGVPWRRCWCVITPPDEKEHAKLQKELKKRSAYDRSHVPTLKGNIKFYDTRKDGKKQKKAQPIASITDAYSAYAIYPQAKSLIDASTLLKIEGQISIHADPPSSTEGFVFVMPEARPAVSGFEMLLRFLFPTWDTFGLYGRPGRLVASTLDAKSLMFAMPKHKRYGYMEILDVSGLILEDGSTGWNEKEWRRKMKETTGTRMNAIEDGSSSRSRSGSRKSVRLSFGESGRSRHRIGFSDDSVRSSRSVSVSGNGPPRTDSAPPDPQRERPPPSMAGLQANNGRSSSDTNMHGNVGAPPPLQDFAPSGNPYSGSPQRTQVPARNAFQDRVTPSDYTGSEDERGPVDAPPLRELDGMRKMQTPEPVSRPPAFNHAPQGRPTSKAYHSPELRRANSRLSVTTLAQLATAGGLASPNDTESPRRDLEDARSGPSVLTNANSVGTSANDNRSREALSPPNQNPSSAGLPPPLNMSKQRSNSPMAYGPPSPYGRGPNPNSRPGTSEGRRSPMPPGGQMGQGPRGPHPQNPNSRQDQNRPPPELGPDGRPRPPQHRGPPGQGPPGNGPPNQGPYNNNYRPAQPRGPPGPQSPPRQVAHRKPLPDRVPNNFESHNNSIISSSSVITTNEIIDHYAFDQGRPREPLRPGTANSGRRPLPPQPQRRGSDQSSHYDDDDQSIDYASTQKSTETSKSVDRPRAGVLKTTGGDEPEMPGRQNFDIPEINFGPTINYGATQAQNKTPMSLVPGGGGPGQTQRSYSPANQRPMPPAHGSSGPQAPHGRKDSDGANKRTMAWQPGVPSPGNGPQGLSAEQYVQQKAAHARTASGNTLGGMRSTTPSPNNFKRNSSSDKLNQRHSRNNSADMLSRPGSRGANSALNVGSSGEASSHLSAREQEQLARMTGAPLITVPGHQRQGSQGPGLVGAIEAREREKQAMRQGTNSPAVQSAINQRQQQQAAMAYQQQMQQQQMAHQQMAQQQMMQQQMQQQQMAQQQAYQQQQQQQHMVAERGMSPQPLYSTMGRGGGQYGPPGGAPYGGPQNAPQMAAASFSRPLRAGTGSPQQVDPRALPPTPNGQYGQPAPQPTPRNVHPQRTTNEAPERCNPATTVTGQGARAFKALSKVDGLDFTEAPRRDVLPLSLPLVSLFFASPPPPSLPLFVHLNTRHPLAFVSSSALRPRETHTCIPFCDRQPLKSAVAAANYQPPTSSTAHRPTSSVHRHLQVGILELPSSEGCSGRSQWKARSPHKVHIATQNVLDPRRVGKQNSGFSDEDISDIICILYPHSDSARQELQRLADEDSPHVIGKDSADDVEPNYAQEDDAGRFLTNTTMAGNYAIILRLSTQLKDPAAGFAFGRNAARCDVVFLNDPLRRLSNIHFRIYVNEYGSVMIEDQSTNGTWVDKKLLASHPQAKGREEPPMVRYVLSSGAIIKIYLHQEARDLTFRIRIPRRADGFVQAYIKKVDDFFARHRLRRQNETITPGPGGHVDLFRPPVHTVLRRLGPDEKTMQQQQPRSPTKKREVQQPREWTGSGKYNRTGQIGRGAFAVVHKVTSMFDGLPYAAKEIEKRMFIKNGVLDQKVENEMKIMRRVQHPHIVRYIENFDWDDRLLIIIMEYVPGGDLGKFILENNHRPLAEDVVQIMAKQLLGALGYLHANNITHRDVKPDNILINSLDPIEVKLTDFGLSKMVDTEQTFLRTFCGTLLYCAPEVYTEFAEYDDNGIRSRGKRVRRMPGQRYNHAVDIWSLGGVLFYTLTGAPPYPVKTSISHSELLHKIMTTRLNITPLQRNGVSEQAIDFLCRMLQRRPENRATVAELESHPWSGGTESTIAASQSYDEITDDEDIAGDLSQYRDPQYEEDRVSDSMGEEDEKENYTFGPETQQPRLFGEVGISAIGSSGVIPEDFLNLPPVDASSGETEILGDDVDEAYESDDSATPKNGNRRVYSQALGSIAQNQSADQMQSLVENVASQSLGGSVSIILDPAGTFGGGLLQPSGFNSSFNTSKRKPPSNDTSEEYDDSMFPRKPTMKRLKSDVDMDSLADEVIEEYKLLARIPQVERLQSGRQIDGPVTKMIFWAQQDRGTWHLDYPEMTQLQYEAFSQAARENGESFGPGDSPLWRIAMKYFPPASRAEATNGQANFGSRMPLRRDERRMLDDTAEIPSTAAPIDTESMPNTLPPETQIVVPVQEEAVPNRLVGMVESDVGSCISGISVAIADSLVSFGRGPENTQVFTPRLEPRVPKYAMKVLLWKEGDGYDPAKDPAKVPLPWLRDSTDDPNLYSFYISSKATLGIRINGYLLPSSDSRNPGGPARFWTQVFDGDSLLIWGNQEPQNQTKLNFRCFWGGSSRSRGDDKMLKLAPEALAQKLDFACQRAEKRIRDGSDKRTKISEAKAQHQERMRLVESERQRSVVFEAKRQEAANYLLSKQTQGLRRGSPASLFPAARLQTMQMSRMSPEKETGLSTRLLISRRTSAAPPRERTASHMAQFPTGKLHLHIHHVLYFLANPIIVAIEEIWNSPGSQCYNETSWVDKSIAISTSVSFSVAVEGKLVLMEDRGIASFYSYVAFADLLKNMDNLVANGVEVEFHPVFLGAINHLSGNKPPWLLPAKAHYLAADSQRAAARVLTTKTAFPKDFMSMSKTISPLRALHFIKAHYPPATFLAALRFLFQQLWTPPHVNLTIDDNLAAALAAATTDDGERLFGDEEVRTIMEGREGMKERLKEVTGEAVERGAFGAPWLWVVDVEGRTGAFFGSDRFNHVYQHLGIPFQDVAVLAPSKL